MPSYPPPTWNPSSQYWVISFCLDTPLGRITAQVVPQANTGIGGNFLLSARGSTVAGAYGVVPTGFVRTNADTLITLGYEPVPSAFTGTTADVNGNNFNLPLPSTGGWDDYLIGINLGVRQSGKLGCCLSISYVPKGGGKITSFWAQDISYYRLWDFASAPPPFVTSTTQPSSPSGWFYIGSEPNPYGPGNPRVYVPFATAYPVVSAVQNGNGVAVWASEGSPALGQLYQQSLPTPANVMPPPSGAPAGYLADYNNTLNTYATALGTFGLANSPATYAFVGDVFVAQPNNFLLGAYPWNSDLTFTQSLGSSYDCMYSFNATLFNFPTSLGPPIFNPNYSTWNPLYSHWTLNLDPAYIYDPGPAFFLPIQWAASSLFPVLPLGGIPVGLGCTLYYLYATAPHGVV